jgi:peptidoglycan-associated lipoprotein
MLSKRWSVCAAAALLYGGVAAAQQPGTLLLGGFGQYTIFDNSLKTGGSTGAGIDGNKVGFGGRVGAFISPNWDIEAEGSYTNATSTGPADIKYGPVAARLVYGLPVYGRSAILFGVGGVLSPFHNDVGGAGNFYTYKYGVSGDLGLRIPLGDMFALRGDAIADYHPSSPSMTNYRFQAGLEAMPDFMTLMGRGATAPANFAWWDEQPQPQPGTVELKGFGQYNYYDSKLNFEHGASAIGGGAGVGVFLTPNWEVEGDGSYAPPKTTSSHAQGAGVKYDNGNFSLRLNYNMPIGARSSFIIGAGAVRSSFHRHDNLPAPYTTYGFGPEGLVGFRLGLANRVALRVDGLADYPMGGLSTWNFAGRVGLSFMLGGAPRAAIETTTVAPPPPPPPAPAPAPAPPPPPPAPVDTTKITASIYFDFDKSDIRSDAQATLDAKIPYLQANPGMRIRIEGNTDERGSDEYNLALGQRRAASAKKYLVDHGIDAGRIDIVSYGEERPVCREHNETCWQQNRRDDFRILVVGADSIVAPQTTTP